MYLWPRQLSEVAGRAERERSGRTEAGGGPTEFRDDVGQGVTRGLLAGQAPHPRDGSAFGARLDRPRARRCPRARACTPGVFDRGGLKRLI